MHMVVVTLGGKDVYSAGRKNFGDELLKPLLDAINVKDLATVAWAKNKMIMDERYGGFRSSVDVFHRYNMA